MFKRILIATFGMALISALAVTSKANSAAQPSVDISRPEASIHVDCLDHDQPRLCSRVVEELIADLGHFNEAFSPPNLDRLAKFFHEDAVVFSNGRFFVGRDEITNDFFAPLVTGILNATVDISAFHFRVIGPNLVILFGSPATVVTFKDGSTVTLPPLPQTLTWARQGDRLRPFVILTDHE